MRSKLHFKKALSSIQTEISFVLKHLKHAASMSINSDYDDIEYW